MQSHPGTATSTSAIVANDGRMSGIACAMTAVRNATRLAHQLIPFDLTNLQPCGDSGRPGHFYFKQKNRTILLHFASTASKNDTDRVCFGLTDQTKADSLPLGENRQLTWVF